MLRIAFILLAVGLIGWLLSNLPVNFSGVRAIVRALFRSFGAAVLFGFGFWGIAALTGMGASGTEIISVTLLSWPLTFLGILFSENRRSRDPQLDGDGDTERSDSEDARSFEDEPEPVGDSAIAMAWEEALAMVPADERLAMRRARRSCARLLTRLESGELALDMAAIEHGMLIRKHLPSLVSQTSQVTRDLAAAERQMTLDRMIDHLLDFGSKAQEILDNSAQTSRRKLDTLSTHLANRIGRGQQSSSDT